MFLNLESTYFLFFVFEKNLDSLSQVLISLISNETEFGHSITSATHDQILTHLLNLEPSPQLETLLTLLAKVYRDSNESEFFITKALK
jgi:hypothetical protein